MPKNSTFMKRLLIKLSIIFIFFSSCNNSSVSNPDPSDIIALDFVTIVGSIKMSTKSRLEFQEVFAAALDSFSSKDVANVNFDQIKSLLVVAKNENEKATQLAASANEVDTVLRYRKAVIEMFKLFEEAYKTDYPNIIQIMENPAGSKKLEAIHGVLFPAYDTLKMKSKRVIEIGKLVAEKHNLNLHEVE